MGAQIARILDENDSIPQSDVIEGGYVYSSDSSSDSGDSLDDYSISSNGCLSEKDLIAAANDPFRVEKRMIAGADTWTYEIYAKDTKSYPFFAMFFAQ